MSKVTLKWDDARPIFIDFETQSACDLTKHGGRRYAQHHSTRILSLVVDIDNIYHCWFPHLQNQFQSFNFDQLRGSGIDTENLRIYSGETIPDPIRHAVCDGRTFVGHNVMGFDRFIWERFLPDCRVQKWADTIYLARSIGLPGSLDRVATATLNERKDSAKRLVMPLTIATIENCKVNYKPVTAGLLGPLIRYNLVDVVLVRELWEKVFVNVEVEADVIQSTVDINELGIKADAELLKYTSDLSLESMNHAAKKIEEITQGCVAGQLTASAIRSVKQMHEWLAKMGIRIVTTDKNGELKKTLRKDIVELCLNNPELMIDPDSPIVATADIDPIVFDVLRLRAASQRITAKKVERAIDRLSPEHRLHDVHSYYAAHTGRFASVGLNLHNLPKAKTELGKKSLGFDGIEYLLNDFEEGKKVSVWDVTDEYHRLDDLCHEWTALAKKKDPKARPLTVDDLCSALIRPSLVASEGYTFGIADYAAIEARGIAWIANCKKLLDVFAAGEDVYCSFGANLFGRILDPQVDKNERNLSKIAVLGLGYGLGESKFGLFCGNAGIRLADFGFTAKKVVDTYRQTYPEIAGYYSGSLNGKAFRRGGIWDQLSQAAMAAVAEGGEHSAGRCMYSFDGISLICKLPSGRQLYYRNCRIEDRIPNYVYALGIEPRYKATLVYDHPQGYESTLYGGKLAENCLAADTKVLTDRGILPIIDVTHEHKVWDGHSWVKTDGVIYKGIREVGTWLGVRLTCDHLIFDGMKWKSVIDMGENATRDALYWAADSVHSSLLSRGSAMMGGRLSSVIAETNSRSITGDWYGKNLQNAQNAGTGNRGYLDKNTPILFQITSYGTLGYIGTLEWYRDVRIPHPKFSKTTGGVVFKYAENGWNRVNHSYDTLSHYQIGINSRATWIGSTTIRDMNPVILESHLGKQTVITDEIRSDWYMKGKNTQSRNSLPSTLLNGRNQYFSTTTIKDDPLNGVWISTGKHEKVYDLLNCGPDSRFTIITDAGPVVVHNCVQAICRDLLVSAICRLMDRGYRVVLDVHDEIVTELAEEGSLLYAQLADQARIMTEVPLWAKGFPISVEAYSAKRYLKAPPKESISFEARNGELIHV